MLTLQASLAGQFVRLQVMVGGKPVTNTYSLVNSSKEPNAEVYFNIVPDGKVSSTLGALQAGDTLETSQPTVGFLLWQKYLMQNTFGMLATGTGLELYLSMIFRESTV